MSFVRSAGPHFFTMWPLKTLEFATPALAASSPPPPIFMLHFCVARVRNPYKMLFLYFGPGKGEEGGGGDVTCR